MEKGKSIPYSLNNLQERGKFFVDPNEDIYEGQVIGENSRGNDSYGRRRYSDNKEWILCI